MGMISNVLLRRDQVSN